MNLALRICLKDRLMGLEEVITLDTSNLAELDEALQISCHHRQLAIERPNRLIIEGVKFSFSWRNSAECRDRDLHKPLSLDRIARDVQDFCSFEFLHERKSLLLFREDDFLVLPEWEGESTAFAKFCNLGVLLCISKRHALVVANLVLLRKGDFTTIDHVAMCLLNLVNSYQEDLSKPVKTRWLDHCSQTSSSWSQNPRRSWQQRSSYGQCRENRVSQQFGNPHPDVPSCREDSRWWWTRVHHCTGEQRRSSGMRAQL